MQLGTDKEGGSATVPHTEQNLNKPQATAQRAPACICAAGLPVARRDKRWLFPVTQPPDGCQQRGATQDEKGGLQDDWPG